MSPVAMLSVGTLCSVNPKSCGGPAVVAFSRGRGAGLSLSDNFTVVGTCGSGFPKGEECLNLLYGGVALL